MWCGLRVRPVTGSSPEARDPVHLSPAVRAVEHELLQLTLEVSLHVQKLQPEHLRLDRDGVGAVQPGIERLVHDRVCGSGLLGDQSHRKLKDVALAPPHDAMLKRRTDIATPRRNSGGQFGLLEMENGSSSST